MPNQWHQAMVAFLFPRPPIVAVEPARLRAFRSAAGLPVAGEAPEPDVLLMAPCTRIASGTPTGRVPTW